MMRIVLTTAFLMMVTGCQERTELTKAPALPADAVSDQNGLNLEQTHAASDPGAPLDQPKNPADEEITANIRKELMDTKMFANLQNIQVTTQEGNVKLRGTVKTDEEKLKVEEIARTAVGAKTVNSEIEVE